MRFPVNVTGQKKCPVCKAPSDGAKSPTAPRAESASLSFVVQFSDHGRSYPVFLGGHLFLGWDSGVSRHWRSRSTLGASVFALKKDARDESAGTLNVDFCSMPCLRQFLMACCDELERQAAEVMPEVAAARAKTPSPKSRHRK